MKKSLILLLMLALLLCACGESGSQNQQSVREELLSAINATNSENAFSGKYMVEISFGQGVALYYASGDVECDRAENKASAAFSQSYLGVSANAKNYIANGKVVSVEGENATEIALDAKALLEKFPYGQIFSLPEQAGNIAVKESTVGTTYTVARGDTKQICESVVGEDIYELADVLKQPQKDKTEYGETECIYTVSDGKVTGVRYEFDIKLYDTPAYVPDYSVPESEYTLKLHVVAKISYNAFGESVTVKEYSQASNKEEISS